AIPRIPDPRGPVDARFGQLPGLPGWSDAVDALRPAQTPEDVQVRLTELVTAATLRYVDYGPAQPVLLVHTATAPNAVLHTLPALPRKLWIPSLMSVWSVTAAIVAAYASASLVPEEATPNPPSGPDAVADVVDRAVSHGDEHVIKFTDTAAEVYTRTGHPGALIAALPAGTLIRPNLP